MEIKQKSYIPPKCSGECGGTNEVNMPNPDPTDLVPSITMGILELGNKSIVNHPTHGVVGKRPLNGALSNCSELKLNVIYKGEEILLEGTDVSLKFKKCAGSGEHAGEFLGQWGNEEKVKFTLGHKEMLIGGAGGKSVRELSGKVGDHVYDIKITQSNGQDILE